MNKLKNSVRRRIAKRSDSNNASRLAPISRSETQNTLEAQTQAPLREINLNPAPSPADIKKVLEDFFGAPVAIETALRNPKTNGITVVTVPTDAEANEEFIKAAAPKNKDEGRNDYVARFQTLADLILRGPGAVGSFSFQDFLIANRMFEIPRDELERLFGLLEGTMTRLNKWSRIEGCYDFPVYVIVA